MMIVAIHQPNFLPWLGFFHKMISADVFILLDNVPFSKNSFQNRVKIKSPQGDQWLTVPVLTKGRSDQLTCDVLINNHIRWQKKHLAALRTNYQRAPCYEQVLDWLGSLYDGSATHLACFNISLIEAVRYQLGLSRKVVLASSLHVGDSSGSQLLLDLVRIVGGDVYLSGIQHFQHPIYPQVYRDFIPGLSIIDLLMNVLPAEALSYLTSDLAFPQSLSGRKVTMAQPC
jgi:hypothetical protein